METIPVGQAVLRKVVAKLGGTDVAADQLGVNQRILHHYVHGRIPVPDAILLRAVDIVLDDLPGILKESRAATNQLRVS